MKTKITNEMLAKYFSGNCSDQEKQEVEHWKEISEDNSRAFEEMKALWRNAFITNTYNPDTKASLHKINSKLGFFNKEKAPDSKGVGFPVHRFIFRAAAVLLIICAGYWFFHLYTETTKNQVLYSASEINEKKNVILPDSSVSEYNPDFSYLWTRNKIKYLDDYTKFYFGDENYRQQSNKEIIGINKEVSEPGLKINLITQETSSIAVDSIVRDKSHEIVKEKQPLPLPEGVSNLAVAENNMESVMGTTVEDMLQGRSGNVDISAISGDPGAGLNIRIRGTSSLNSNNNPLIVVNGIPYNATYDQDFDFGSADIEKFGALIDVSPKDIESIEVLKDSATTAKWGARASNGVLDIKTKRYMKSGLEDVVATDSKIGDDEFIPVRDRETAIVRMELKGMESLMGTTVEDMLKGRLSGFNSAIGQSSIIRGTITDSKTEEALILVNVVEMDKNGRNVTRTVTDANGNYTFNVTDVNNDIQVSYIGYSKQIFKVNNRSVIDIKLDAESIMLEDVDLTGLYIGNDGIIPVRDRETAIARMELKGMEKVMGTTVEDMLQGRLGNVDITAVSGDPAADLNIRIRGTASLNSKNYPLIVVNGIIYNADYADLENFDFTSADIQKFANLIDVLPEEIESIEVLKDAATISKYGAAAANGVLSIKTKDGKTEK